MRLIDVDMLGFYCNYEGYCKKILTKVIKQYCLEIRFYKEKKIC